MIQEAKQTTKVKIYLIEQPDKEGPKVKTEVAYVSEAVIGANNIYPAEGVSPIRVDLSQLNGRATGEHPIFVDIPGLAARTISMNRRNGTGVNTLTLPRRWMMAELTDWRIRTFAPGRNPDK